MCVCVCVCEREREREREEVRSHMNSFFYIIKCNVSQYLYNLTRKILWAVQTRERPNMFKVAGFEN